MSFKILKEQLSDFKGTIHQEWALTNGIGGYAGGCINGALSRTHQGYLIACYHPPVSRYLVFSKINEIVKINGKEYDLETSQHKGCKIKEGNKYLTNFIYDRTVSFTYQVENITIRKNISLVPNENTSGIGYEFENNGEKATISLTPLMNFREHSQNVTSDMLKFSSKELEHGFILTPEENPDVKIYLNASDGTLIPRENQYDVDTELQVECDNEVDGLDNHYTPYDIVATIPSGKSQLSIICQSTMDKDFKFLEVDKNSAFLAQKLQEEHIDNIIKNANCPDKFSKDLTIASNQFLAYRESTGYMTVLAGLPWFTDWGRDTMIAYTGLTLCTNRFKEARDILLTFSKYVKNGMIPNMFPDNNLDPLYNTVDASLWYFYAVYKYLHYDNTPEAWSFIQENIYPCLKEIIRAYKNGTDFSIYMDIDYLIHAGSGLDQVTWMDVRVGDWVATPRHGKPVEISALWYNALKVMELLANKYGENATSYSELAQNVKENFCAKFWNSDTGCLYDVIDDSENDPSIRPNQIYAVSLPFTMLTPEQNRSIVDVVKDKLYVGCGLRSLSPDHKDYHPIYLGSLEKRDHAYHQGTAWGFLLGGFITAYVKAYGNTPEVLAQANKMLEPVRKHLEANCIGSICEIFDGNAPHSGRGCYAQAWSVGEILRCYKEDILQL